MALCLVLWAGTTALATMSGGVPTPPPRPSVAPLVSDIYPSDTDGNRIDDQLEGRIEGSPAGVLRSMSSNTSRGAVGVELIFSEPVTQDQIDAFLALGGRITYMYRAVSYGWNGRIDTANVQQLPTVMGPTLVQVTGVPKIQWYLDLATQSGRVRPVWKPGFAGSVAGFTGNPDTTIAFIDTGVDAGHKDLSGRCVYWKDMRDDPQAEPTDTYGHGSMVAGVAVGTGDSAGSNDTVLKYTYVDDFPFWLHFTDHITLPFGNVTMKARATWKGGSAVLDHVVWSKGRPASDLTYLDRYVYGGSPLTLNNTVFASEQACYAAALYDPFDYRALENVVIVHTVDKYPGVGDGFNTFSGVAPNCKWAAVGIPVEDSDDEFENELGAAVDDLVANRKGKRIKIINISGGLIEEDGFPRASTSFRNKINSAVRNGVIVVAAAGNSADAEDEAERNMTDPARAALAISVGASNDENALTEYSNYGFTDPDSNAGEDFKPDLVAPGGSSYYSTIMSVDSGTCDGAGNPDQEPHDYAAAIGTSFSSPFVAGCAALVIEAMERGGVTWDFSSDRDPRFVKMVLCATASETNALRESKDSNPTLQRSSHGPDGFPAGKDRYEGYGLINADAAVEAVNQTYALGTSVGETFGEKMADRRVWARTVQLIGGCGMDLTLDNPAGGDFDLYLYSTSPSSTGTPVLLAFSAKAGVGADESISYTPSASGTALIVVKRVSGSGTFALSSEQAGPPVAQNVSVSAGLNSPTPVTLVATDDGTPDPPGRLTYTIASLPRHGKLERVADAKPITTVPTALSDGGNQVVYRPDSGWVGEDSFTYYANDGGTSPYGGRSNTATVSLSVVHEVSVTYKVAAGADDAHALRWGTVQSLSDRALIMGQYVAGMRFRDVGIPQGARILKATLKVRSYTDSLGAGIRTPIYAEAADDAAEFDNSGRRVNSVANTSASHVWDLSGTTWKSNTWYESPDFSEVIQEVIDRPGWAAGNALVVICGADDHAPGNRKFWSYDGDPSGAAQLEITYRP